MVQTMRDLFAAMAERAEELTYTIGLSYLEVYNEQIRDLLPGAGAGGSGSGAGSSADSGASSDGSSSHSGASRPLPLREDSKDGMVVAGLSTHHPTSSDQVPCIYLGIRLTMLTSSVSTGVPIAGKRQCQSLAMSDGCQQRIESLTCRAPNHREKQAAHRVTCVLAVCSDSAAGLNAVDCQLRSTLPSCR